MKARDTAEQPAMHTTVPHHKESSSGTKVEKHCASDKGAETVKKDRILTVLCCAGLESLRVPRSREKRSIFKYSKYVSINGQTEKALKEQFRWGRAPPTKGPVSTTPVPLNPDLCPVFGELLSI